jgi:hypothetical protein
VFTYIGLALALLKFVNGLMDYFGREEALKAGADAEIAKISAAILRKTTAGKAIMERIDALSDADVDAELRRLGSE